MSCINTHLQASVSNFRFVWIWCNFELWENLLLLFSLVVWICWAYVRRFQNNLPTIIWSISYHTINKSDYLIYNQINRFLNTECWCIGWEQCYQTLHWDKTSCNLLMKIAPAFFPYVCKKKKLVSVKGESLTFFNVISPFYHSRVSFWDEKGAKRMSLEQYWWNEGSTSQLVYYSRFKVKPLNYHTSILIFLLLFFFLSFTGKGWIIRLLRIVCIGIS